MDDDFRLLAIVNYDAGHVDSDIVRSNNNEMSIQSLISGIVMLFAPVEEVAVAEKVYKGLLMTDKIIEKIPGTLSRFKNTTIKANTM